jgi:hypothetical protein
MVNVTRIIDYISDAAVSTVSDKTAGGTEAPPNGDGRRTVRRLSQHAGSLFSRNGLAIYPKPTTTNQNDKKTQPQPKSSAQQPPVRSEEISATEGWIKVSQLTELDLAARVPWSLESSLSLPHFHLFLWFSQLWMHLS